MKSFTSYQQRATFLTVYPPPPRTSRGILKLFTNSTHSLQENKKIQITADFFFFFRKREQHLTAFKQMKQTTLDMNSIEPLLPMSSYTEVEAAQSVTTKRICSTLSRHQGCGQMYVVKFKILSNYYCRAVKIQL